MVVTVGRYIEALTRREASATLVSLYSILTSSNTATLLDTRVSFHIWLEKHISC